MLGVLSVKKQPLLSPCLTKKQGAASAMHYSLFFAPYRFLRFPPPDICTLEGKKNKVGVSQQSIWRLLHLLESLGSLSAVDSAGVALRCCGVVGARGGRVVYDILTQSGSAQQQQSAVFFVTHAALAL